MDKLIERISLGVILRHLICGGVFTFSSALTHSKDLHSTLKFLSKNPVLFGLSSLIGGTIIYGIHRGTLNIIYEHLKTSECIRKHIEPLLFSNDSLKDLLNRWEQRENSAEKPHEKEKITSDHIESWADWAHLLYTSGLALWLGSITIFYKHKPCDLQPDCLILLTGFILLLAGFTNDIRKQVVEKSIYSQKYQQNITAKTIHRNI